MECPNCWGHGDATDDPAKYGTYGTCKQCFGSGKVVDPELVESLMQRVDEMETRLAETNKMADGAMILGILDEADKNREKFEATARKDGMTFNQIIAAAITQAIHTPDDRKTS